MKLRLVQRATDAAVTPPPAQVHDKSPQSALSQLADESLVRLLLEGEQGGAEALYRRHAGFAFNLATRIAGSKHDVEDVVHDAFLRAFSRLGSLREPSKFKGWLGSIIVYAMRSRLRRAKFVRVLGFGQPGDPIDLDCLASNDCPPSARAELAQVYALLQTLPADDRIAWTLRHVQGHELKEAAELASCSLATVKRRIGRAQRYIEQHFVTTDERKETDESDEMSDRTDLLEASPRPKSKGAAS